MRIALLITLSVVAVGLTGCLIVPAGTARRPLPSAGKDLAFVRNGKTSRTEITNRLGAFDEYFEDLRVGSYLLNDATRTRLWLALGLIPVGTTKYEDHEIAYFEFDQNDCVRRHRVVWNVVGRYGAEDWMGKHK